MADININWYPGHMNKARRLMEEQLKLVDIVVEIRDARLPLASGNPLLIEMANSKPRLIILNKADLADEKENILWLKQFDHSLLVNSSTGNITNQVVGAIQTILKDKLDKAKARGIKKKTLRAMVVGIPNVGKSTFINNIVKKKVAKAQNCPGVTKNLQWVRINEDVELLDTPGVLWPKIEDQDDALLLALVGSINDETFDREYVLNYGLNYIYKYYPDDLINYCGQLNKEIDLIEQIALKKNWLGLASQIDRNRAIDQLLKDLRNGKMGRITWQKALN